MTVILKTVLFVILLNNDGTVDAQGREVLTCPDRDETTAIFQTQKDDGLVADYWIMCGTWKFETNDKEV